MIRFVLCAAGDVETGGRDLLRRWQSQPDTWLWVDLQDEPAENERSLLVGELGLDALAVAQAQRPRHPPGFEAFTDYLYLLTKPLTADSDDLEFTTLQLATFAGPRLLVTRHSKHSRFIERLYQRLLDEGCADTSPMSIVATIARRVCERYGNVLLDLERRLDEIEDQLFDTRSDRLMQELVGYNTALRKMRRIIAYHTNAFAALRDYFAATDLSLLHDEFTDIHSVMERFHSLAELYQSVISDLIDGYISLNAHNLNQIMKVLTIVTVIFVPLTLLVGVYGMNFENMPELKSAHGYFVLLGIMSVIAFGLLLLFKRIRWL